MSKGSKASQLESSVGSDRKAMRKPPAVPPLHGLGEAALLSLLELSAEGLFDRAAGHAKADGASGVAYLLDLSHGVMSMVSVFVGIHAPPLRERFESERFESLEPSASKRPVVPPKESIPHDTSKHEAARR